MHLHHQTPNLLLRPLRAADAPAIYTFYSTPEMMAWRGAAVFTTPDEAEALLFHWRKLEALQRGFRVGIAWKETGQLIGTAGFKHIDHTHHSGEIGYELLPAFWNRGYMTEAMQPLIAQTAARYQLHTVTANIDPGHTASKRVLEKLGFVQEAHYRENYFFERWWDSAIWVKHL